MLLFLCSALQLVLCLAAQGLVWYVLCKSVWLN